MTAPDETPQAYILRLIRTVTDDATIAAFVTRVMGEPVTRRDVAELRRTGR